MSTLHCQTIAGIPCTIPNRVTKAPTPDFYLSLNTHDTSIYGCTTTALVLGQMQRFYILSGDHVSAFKGKAWPDVSAYLLAHSEARNKRSDPFPLSGLSIAEILALPDPAFANFKA